MLTIQPLAKAKKNSLLADEMLSAVVALASNYRKYHVNFVSYISRDGKELSGCCRYADRTIFVAVKSQDAMIVAYTVAHELAHAILHHHWAIVHREIEAEILGLEILALVAPNDKKLWDSLIEESLDQFEPDDTWKDRKNLALAAMQELLEKIRQ